MVWTAYPTILIQVFLNCLEIFIEVSGAARSLHELSTTARCAVQLAGPAELIEDVVRDTG